MALVVVTSMTKIKAALLMLMTRMTWNIRSTCCLLWVTPRLKQNMLCSSITMFLVSSYVYVYIYVRVQYTHSCARTHVLSYIPLDAAIPYLLNPPTVVLSNDPMKAVHKPIISPPSSGKCMRFYLYEQAPLLYAQCTSPTSSLRVHRNNETIIRRWRCWIKHEKLLYPTNWYPDVYIHVCLHKHDITHSS